MANLVSVKTLDMVNGEITKVAYGGVEYECVEGEAKAGDVALAIKSAEDTTLGNFYPITDISYGEIMYMDDADDEQVNPLEYFRIFRKVAASTNPSVEERVAKAEGEIESLKSDVAALKGAAEPKPERLKVGDYAKVVDVSNGVSKRGDIVRIIEDDKSAAPFLSEHLNGNSAGWFHEYELVRATDEEVAEANRAAEFAKFKEGAKVRLKSGGGKFPLNGYENGKVYEVGYVCFPRDSIHIIGGNACRGFATPDQLEILSEEEAAELKKWAEIGREVGEYKVGDIFRSPNGNLYEINRIDDRLGYPIGFKDSEGFADGYKRDAAITLVTPVEARFDR